MSIKKIQWIDLTIIILWVISLIDAHTLFLLHEPEFYYIIPLFFDIYFICRMAHILKTKTAYTWLSFATFILNAIFSLNCFVYLSAVLIVPYLQSGPIGLGFMRVYFNYEVTFIMPLVIIPLTIVCCTKINKYKAIGKKEISFKEIDSYDKSSVIINILITLVLIAALSYYFLKFKNYDHYILCSIFMTSSLILFVKNMCIILKKKSSNNIINLIFNLLFIVLLLYSFEAMVSNYGRVGNGTNYSLIDSFHVITLFICTASLISVICSIVFDACSTNKINKPI